VQDGTPINVLQTDNGRDFKMQVEGTGQSDTILNKHSATRTTRNAWELLSD
jgi:hypothetical protein